MTGSIQKKGKSYFAVIAFNGKRKWYKGGRRKDAERVLNEKIAELTAGTYREIPKITFEKFAEYWIRSHVENTVKASTLAGYSHLIYKRLIPEFGNYLMSDIAPVLLQTYVTKRKGSTDARTKSDDKESMAKLLSSKTILNEVAVIKKMFKDAHEIGYLKVNPAHQLKRPKIVKTEIEILQQYEIQNFLENSDGLYRVAFLAALLTGVRAGELWALKWGDVDWRSKQLFVRRSVWHNDFQTPKTKNAIRQIDLPDNLIFELRKWKLACPISEYDLMFPTHEGKITCHDNVVKRYFQPALRRAGLRHISFHGLRHTNASLRIKAAQNLKYMSMQMGHSSIKVTMDTYGHLFKDEGFNRQQANLLQKVFQPVRKPLEKPLQNAEKGLAVFANPL